MTRLSLDSLRLAPAMLVVAAGTFLLTVGRTAHTANTPAGCPRCQADGCQLEAYQFTNPLGIDYVQRCVDFDGVPPGHCATTERQHEQIVQASQRDPNHGYEIGDCYMLLCSAATPTSTPCTNPLPVGNTPGANMQNLPASSVGCPVNPAK